MEIHATLKNVPMSPQKMREMVRQIQGLPAQHAQAVLRVVPRKSARFVFKTLTSAMANAENLRDEWKQNKIQQTVSDLQSQVANTRDGKRKTALQRKLALYQSFLGSANRLAPEKLRVKEAVAGTAMIIRRFMPKARGSAGPILKRRCHIKITLSDD